MHTTSSGGAEAREGASLDRRYYLLLLLPVALSLASLYFWPAIFADPGVGFLVLRSMLQGGAFNIHVSPDPANIAQDAHAYLTWWSPGQYLAPGLFVWLGAGYGLAISFTVLIAAIVAAFGWVKVARSFGVTAFVLVIFLVSVVSFRHVTLPFRIYTGGEVLLFAAAPWSLYWLRRSVDETPFVAFFVTIACAFLLFFAKLSGLIVLLTTALALGAIDIWTRRRLRPAVAAMWVACAISALCVQIFWLSRGAVPADGSGFSLSLSDLWSALSGAAFAGFSLQDVFAWFFMHPSRPMVSDLSTFNLVLGPAALLLMIWVWLRLRVTAYRDMAILLFSIIGIYVAVMLAINARGAEVGFPERHFRYPGMLFLLLLLVAVDASKDRIAKALALAAVAGCAAYGVLSYVQGVRPLMSGRYFDSVSGTSQMIVTPDVLRYLRGEMAQHRWKDAVAVLPSPEAALGLPEFRILSVHMDFRSVETLASETRAGRVEKLYVVVQRKMLGNGKAEAVMKTFTDYPADAWKESNFEDIVVFSQ